MYNLINTLPLISGREPMKYCGIRYKKERYLKRTGDGDTTEVRDGLILCGLQSRRENCKNKPKRVWIREEADKALA